MPYISQVYLVKGSVLRSKLSHLNLFVEEGMDPDMAFCKNVRDQVTPAAVLVDLVFRWTWCSGRPGPLIDLVFWWTWCSSGPGGP